MRISLIVCPVKKSRWAEWTRAGEAVSGYGVAGDSVRCRPTLQTAAEACQAVEMCSQSSMQNKKSTGKAAACRKARRASGGRQKRCSCSLLLRSSYRFPLLPSPLISSLLLPSITHTTHTHSSANQALSRSLKPEPPAAPQHSRAVIALRHRERDRRLPPSAAECDHLRSCQRISLLPLPSPPRCTSSR